MLKKPIWNTIETTVFYYSDNSKSPKICFGVNLVHRVSLLCTFMIIPIKMSTHAYVMCIVFGNKIWLDSLICRTLQNKIQLPHNIGCFISENGTYSFDIFSLLFILLSINPFQLMQKYWQASEIAASNWTCPCQNILIGFHSENFDKRL